MMHGGVCPLVPPPPSIQRNFKYGWTSRKKDMSGVWTRSLNIISLYLTLTDYMVKETGVFNDSGKIKGTLYFTSPLILYITIL